MQLLKALVEILFGLKTVMDYASSRLEKHLATQGG